MYILSHKITDIHCICHLANITRGYPGHSTSNGKKNSNSYCSSEGSSRFGQKKYDARGHRVYTDRYEGYKQYQRWCNNKIFILVLYSLDVLSAGFYLLLTTWWPGQGFIVPVSWERGGVCLHITGHITSRSPQISSASLEEWEILKMSVSVMCPW